MCFAWRVAAYLLHTTHISRCRGGRVGCSGHVRLTRRVGTYALCSHLGGSRGGRVGGTGFMGLTWWVGADQRHFARGIARFSACGGGLFRGRGGQDGYGEVLLRFNPTGGAYQRHLSGLCGCL